MNDSEISWHKVAESDISVMIGLTLDQCERGDYGGNDAIFFRSTCGKKFIMCHIQDCCESVEIEDICGDLADLIGSRIVMAEEYQNNTDNRRSSYDDSHTWTFYRFATAKGYVNVRWYGSSNGYYSESVNFFELKEHAK